MSDRTRERDGYLGAITEQDLVDYERNLAEARRREESVVNPNGVTWAPQPGAQVSFLSCPIFEALLEGTRGGGKTDALLMAFAQHVGRGHGAAWRGVIFRQTYPQLADVVAKSRKWFRLIFGNSARFNEASMTWRWDTGEELLLRHMKRAEDYWNYHGHEYPFIGWEELCNWPDDGPFKAMMSCCRTSTPGVPLMIRATTNPYGPGHNWVKARYRLPGSRGRVTRDAVDSEGNVEAERVAIHSHVDENRILLAANPGYKRVLASSARSPAEAKAWLDGDWDIVAGGLFDDVWLEARAHCVLPSFFVGDRLVVPHSWTLDRSFDWGSSHPFSAAWWAESDGTDLELPDGRVMSTVRGDLVRVAEWYGWNGQPNQGLRMLASEIARGIVERERSWGVLGRVDDGPADSSIFDRENGNCIATDMEGDISLEDGSWSGGVFWERADKSPGSVELGISAMRERIKATVPPARGPRERPGLFVTRDCTHFLRTVPACPRDEKKIERPHEDWEDHVIDETRYRVRHDRRVVRTGRTTGTH